MFTGRKDALVLLCLVVVSIALRLPLFFLDDIDWDESIFILMGQWIADGHLPYTGVWDIKPPLGFLFFAGTVLAFGKDLVMVRLAGAIWLGIAAFIVYRIGRRIGTRFQAGIAALFTLVAASWSITSGQAVMMEHVAMVPLMASVYLLMDSEPARGRYFWAGVLVSAAVLTRLNLAFTAVLVAPLILYIEAAQGVRKACTMAAWFIGGGLLLLVVVYLPYLLSGNSVLFYKSMVAVPLSYSAEGMGFLETLANQTRNALPNEKYFGMGADAWSEIVFQGDHLFRYCLWLGGALGLGRLFLSARSADPIERRRILVLAVYFVSILISIGSAGHEWGHYLIQIAPFFAIGAALLFPSAPSTRGLPFTAGLCVVVLALSYTGVRSGNLRGWYEDLVTRVNQGVELRLGPSIPIASYLEARGSGDYTLFSLDNSLVYWLTGKSPPTPVAAFPWNISKEDRILKPLYGEGATSAGELQRIMDGRPDFVLVSGRSWYRGEPELLDVVVRVLRTDYSLAQRIDFYEVYARKMDLPTE